MVVFLVVFFVVVVGGVVVVAFVVGLGVSGAFIRFQKFLQNIIRFFKPDAQPRSRSQGKFSTGIKG